jgi:tetrahydromethanopterin S-methyltransferase subunit G
MIFLLVVERELYMNIQLELIEDKVEFFEGESLKTIEKKINEQIEVNKSILLSVHSVSHQVTLLDNGRPYYTAVVHFKLKKNF